MTREYRTPAETVHALAGVSLTVAPGEFVALTGPSGCGKTTLLNLIAGLDQPTSGSVSVLGQEVTALSNNRRAAIRLESVGVVFQDNNLIEEFTLLENVMLPLQAAGLPRPEAVQVATESLDRMSIGELAGRHPKDVSGGQRQRAGIARATAGTRRILLADEPTGALDTVNSTSLFALLGSLSRSGTTVVVATHDPTVEAFAERIVRLQDGIIVDEVRIADAKR